MKKAVDEFIVYGFFICFQNRKKEDAKYMTTMMAEGAIYFLVLSALFRTIIKIINNNMATKSKAIGS